MKKFTAILFTLLFVLSAAGCGGETPAPADPSAPADPPAPSAPAAPEAGTPLSTFYDAVLAAQPADAEPLIFFEESNPDLIESFYPGLTEIALDQQAFYMPPIVTAPCEIVLVEVTDGGDVQAVVDLFNARIDQGADNTTYPDSAAGWANNAQVQQSGNFVGMIVLPDGYVTPENIFAQ